jgi:hypothetical protein
MRSTKRKIVFHNGEAVGYIGPYQTEEQKGVMMQDWLFTYPLPSEDFDLDFFLNAMKVQVLCSHGCGWLSCVAPLTACSCMPPQVFNPVDRMPPPAFGLPEAEVVGKY